MKTRLLTAALLSLGALSAVANEPKVYGKANVSFQNADEGAESATELKSNASRIGVKGSLDVEGGYKAIYQAEFEVQFDDGDKDGETFSQRNIFVGLEGGFGTVKAGKFDTPLKTAQKKVDLFNDLEGDIKAMVTESDNRANNIVGYQTPAFGSIKANVAFVASEEEGVDDGISSSLLFEQDDLYVAVAFDTDVEDEGTETIRAVAQYKIAGFQFGALYETMDVDGADDSVDGTFASVKYTLDKLSIKAQMGSSDINEEGGETVSLGVDYKIAKPLKVFAYYTKNESDFEEVVDEGTTDNDYLGVGIELKF